MDVQTVATMHQQAQPSQNHNGTTTPSHILPGDATREAAKRTAATLLSQTEQPSAAPTDVEAIKAAIEQQVSNKEAIQQAVRARLNPQSSTSASPSTPLPPQTVADVTQSAEPVVMPEPKVETPSATPVIDEPDLVVSSEEEANPKAENFKKMRTALSQTKKSVKELLQQKTELETKVQELAPLSDELPKLKERVAQLEPLEHLLNFRTSDATRELLIEPLTNITNELSEIGKDYNVPPEVMEQATTITNRRDLNAFLLHHFDEVEALRIKELVGKAQKLRGDLVQAEAAPKQALERLTQEHLKLNEQKEIKRRSSLVEAGKGSWISAITDIRQSGRYPEFTPREGDAQFNTTWVEPLTKKAAEEYGSLLTYLGQNGLQKLDPEFGKGLASMAARAIGYDTAAARANALEKELAELQQNTQRLNSVLRPGVGQGGGSAGANVPSKPASPKDAAKSLLNSIGVKY